jgi:hypothetical protein
VHLDGVLHADLRRQLTQHARNVARLHQQQARVGPAASGGMRGGLEGWTPAQVLNAPGTASPTIPVQSSRPASRARRRR